MPHINRIRVNNVKYNFGTQAYDDFIMKPFCHNTLYDLANGGGKSVLMLLMLQNVLPNCTLDEKQPVEKLFRTGDGSQTIHSLIEWKLDAGDVVNGFQYMTTGFCAKKASGKEGEEEVKKESASIEYFNYCIFYREYNENDIRNLPLVKEKERITYSGLRKHLKELERDNSLIVRIFDVKREYQAFLSRYGLYESEWEIIRGINKTEGHVRTYFETNYKTTRKVVEDLLIEEIIQKSFQLKAAVGEEESMSKTLLGIREKLVELSKRKKELTNYDRQIDLLSNFSIRLESLMKVYQEMQDCQKDLTVTALLAKKAEQDKNQQYEDQRVQIEELNQSILRYRKRLEQCRIYQKECRKNKIERELEALEQELKQAELKKNKLTESLTERECMNEYMEYLAEKQKRNEAVQALRVLQEKNSDLTAQVACYVYYLKEYWDSLALELSAQLEELKNQRVPLELKSEKGGQEELSLERELAIASNLYEITAKKSLQIQKQLTDLKTEAGLLLLEETPVAVSANEKELDSLKERSKQTDKKIQELSEKESAVLLSKEKVKLNLSQLEQKAEQEQEFLHQFTKDKSKAERLLAAYGKSDYAQLSEEIHKRLKKSIQQTAVLRQDYMLYEEELARLTRGEYSLDDSLLQKAKEYLISRYQVVVLTGIEYLNQEPEEKRNELLSHIPFLPYALVITQGYEQSHLEIRFYGKGFEQVLIPVLNGEAVRSMDVHDLMEHMVLVSKDQSILYDEKRLEQEKNRLKKEMDALNSQIHRMEEQEITYSEDEAYIHVFATTKLLQYQQILKEHEQTKQALIENQEQEQLLFRQLEETYKEKQYQEQKREQLMLDVQEQQQLQQTLKALTAWIKEADRNLEEMKGHEQSQRDVQHQLDESKATNAEVLNRLIEIRQQEEGKRQRIQGIRSEWENRYKNFYVEGSYKKPDISMEEMQDQLNGYLQVMQSKYSDLEDKNRLINSYVQAMNRCLKVIEARGVSLAKLEQAREQDRLVVTLDEELMELKKQQELANDIYKNLYQQKNWQSAQLSRYDGMIEQAITTYENTFGTYVPEEMEEVDFAIFTKEAEQKITIADKEVRLLQEGLEQLKKSAEGYLSISKDVERLLRDNDLSMKVKLGELTVPELKNLQTQAEHLQTQWYRLDKEKRSKLDEFSSNKQKTIQALIALNAVGLAQEMENSVKVPADLEEIQQLIHNLLEVNECLSLEKNRVLGSIQDMQSIKDNFAYQCLQRCLHVKTELERLPKLSRITLEHEQIPMISLSIPYVKEEFFHEKMSAYIDEIVNGTDSFEESSERLKYIRNCLRLKKLFSVIVTDMNAIRLNLYKRERIKEQSRHLRYEEAVGSTGQSQGIYTQFLIAIITYISNVNSRRMENEQLRKVIFIDNPFGAAKDVYIWEPIFELLEQNNVQLIVPARGTTPAITSRFDVNYVLGQKLVNNRQQTVVVDYYSSVKTRETEFAPLNFEQTSFSLFEES